MNKELSDKFFSKFLLNEKLFDGFLKKIKIHVVLFTKNV